MEGIISAVSSTTVIAVAILIGLGGLGIAIGMGLLDAFAVVSVVIGLYFLFAKNPILSAALQAAATLKGAA